jgi:hypothetical protein
MTPSAQLAPAIKQLASSQKTSFATTQAVWRFLNNQNISFETLNAPILALAQTEIAASAHRYALVIHDWSTLQFHHTNKPLRKQMTHSHDQGYGLQTRLLVDAQQGIPIAPLAHSLSHAAGRYTTSDDGLVCDGTHLDNLMQSIVQVESLSLPKKLVHVIDREGDSVAHMRQMSQAGYQWLVRCKEGNRVSIEGHASIRIGDVADQMVCHAIKSFEYKGVAVTLRVAETDVTVCRPAKPKQTNATGQRVTPIAGEPIAARLIIAELVDSSGVMLTRWTLLSNVDREIDTQELAQWYYWRWSIESFFKLIKQAGHDIESWLQTTPQALLKRLLIASMACVLIWRIQRMSDAEGQQLRQTLSRLSGRVQKRGRRESAPSILAGLSIVLNTLQLLSEYSADELRRMALLALNGELGDV